MFSHEASQEFSNQQRRVGVFHPNYQSEVFHHPRHHAFIQCQSNKDHKTHTSFLLHSPSAQFAIEKDELPELEAGHLCVSRFNHHHHPQITLNKAEDEPNIFLSKPAASVSLNNISGSFHNNNNQSSLMMNQHSTSNNQNGIQSSNDDDFFLDTTSMSSLDFSRFFIQNMSNCQNLEELLDYNPVGDQLN